MPDHEIEALRDQFYSLATVARRAFEAGDRLPFNLALGLLPNDDRADVEERAAIAEFEGKLSRDQAERLALAPNMARVRPS